MQASPTWHAYDSARPLFPLISPNSPVAGPACRPRMGGTVDSILRWRCNTSDDLRREQWRRLCRLSSCVLLISTCTCTHARTHALEVSERSRPLFHQAILQSPGLTQSKPWDAAVHTHEHACTCARMHAHAHARTHRWRTQFSLRQH